MGWNFVRIPIYGHLFFDSKLFRRPIAVSRAPKIWVLGMFRWFGIIGQKLDQIFAWPHRRHRWAVGFQDPSTVLVWFLVYWKTAISKTSLTNKSGWTPPPPPLNLLKLVRMPKLNQFLSNLDLIFVYVFKRLIATSRAPQGLVLGMLRWFGIFVPKLDQIWSWLHWWAPGVCDLLKILAQALVYWSTAISKSRFTQKSG